MKRRIATLSELLLETLHGAGQTAYADRAGLYLVELVDDHALAFAVALHTRVRSGPDPAELRRRALAAGVKTPQALGSAPVETLARIAELLGGVRPAECRALAAAIRARHRAGAVPVLLLTEGLRTVRGLADLLAELENAGTVPTSSSAPSLRKASRARGGPRGAWRAATRDSRHRLLTGAGGDGRHTFLRRGRWRLRSCLAPP